MTIQEIEQELFEMGRKLESMFNSCSQDLAIGIEKLRGELAELKESKKECKWKPTQDEKFWYRSNGGTIVSEWFDECSVAQIWKIKHIPTFPTKEECERYWHFMDIVKEKSYSFSKEEWEDDDLEKYYICYDYKRKIFHPSFAWDSQVFGRIHFKTEADAQYIIDNFKDELMEYFV